MGYIEYKTLKIKRRVIQHLGKDLITTPDVAVTELVKNSIDAGSKNIRIHIADSFNSIVSDSPDFLVPYNTDVAISIPDEIKEYPICIVEDMGKGMNSSQLENGFLTIGTDIKKSEKEMMFGEKGIGRLATQRLGPYLLIETASADEKFASTTFIDWNENILPDHLDEDGQMTIPYHLIKKTKSNYTRLWIFGINISDFIETPEQMMLDLGDNDFIMVNRELKTALNYLISPFHESTINISMYYKKQPLNLLFNTELLDLAESQHKFSLDIKDGQLMLTYSLEMKPWYIERVHRSVVKAEAFKRLKQPHGFYEKMLIDNHDRIVNILSQTDGEDDIKNVLADFFGKTLKDTIQDRELRNRYIQNLVEATVENLKKIVPIEGDIYSFKQGVTIGERIILSAVNEKRKQEGKGPLSLDALSSFLNTNNGVKLYRDTYRIGFLGNRESDWLKLQQYSTKGQQYYRFDLGNTLGYVSVRDNKQEYIQEISSRLDISQNEVSLAFKTFINIVFNNLFYQLTRSSNSILRVLLEEQGLLNSSLEKEVKKQTSEIKQTLKRGAETEKQLSVVSELVQMGMSLMSGGIVALPETTVSVLVSTLKLAISHLNEERQQQQQAVQMLAEADEQLKNIEVEAYNNFKLMANGLITETITHELDSVCHSQQMDDMGPHFDNVKKTLLSSRQVPVINHDLKPIQKSYYALSGKMEEVADLYNFVEKTFVKKGSYDEFEYENIKDVAEGIRLNLVEMQKESITLQCTTGDLSWLVPKGVLIHVLYNLFANSVYWIDRRRKYAIADPTYDFDGEDSIVVESSDPNEIIIYDTGTGVLKPMEDILFQPLESGKEKHTGRGMGLYIVQQLLRSFSADIYLDSERNAYGNRYKFVIIRESGDMGNE